MTIQELAPRSRIYRLRLRDYLLLDDAGTFAAFAKTELLDGEIYYMNAQHRPHAVAKIRLYDAVRDVLRESGSPLTALVEVSISMSDHDVPEPDLVLTSEASGNGLVPLSSVAMLAEVADASLTHDLGRKASLYAAAGVPEYWVVDVNARVIHQMWSPAGDAYRERREIAFGDRVDAATIPGLIVATDAL